ncbi:MAG: Arm DNA-binding domain-containing protein [Chloroflexi bacterium]|nr:Arm DNA-binding domain-containing protein [Chloroflexota bacterium]
MTLSATRVRALKEPGRYSDGGGLHLFISKARRKSWVHRITIDGRRRDIGLGGFPSVSLAQAREKAAANRTAVAGGRDPLADSRRPAMPTFKEAAHTVHEANRPRWRMASTPQAGWGVLSDTQCRYWAACPSIA